MHGEKKTRKKTWICLHQLSIREGERKEKMEKEFGFGGEGFGKKKKGFRREGGGLSQRRGTGKSGRGEENGLIKR